MRVQLEFGSSANLVLLACLVYPIAESCCRSRKTEKEKKHLREGREPDPTQKEIERLSLGQLATCRFSPHALRNQRVELGQGNALSSPVSVGESH